MISLVMTILGPDRPGVVESLAKLVKQEGANWLESRMAHLAGQFAGIVHVEVPAEQADALIGLLSTLDRQGLTVIVQKDTAAATIIPPFAPCDSSWSATIARGLCTRSRACWPNTASMSKRSRPNAPAPRCPAASCFAPRRGCISPQIYPWAICKTHSSRSLRT